MFDDEDNILSLTRDVHLDAGALVRDDLGSDGVPAGVLHVPEGVEGLHNGYRLEVADGGLQSGAAHAWECVACLQNEKNL